MPINKKKEERTRGVQLHKFAVLRIRIRFISTSRIHETNLDTDPGCKKLANIMDNSPKSQPKSQEKKTHFCLAHLNNKFINSKTNFLGGHIFFSLSDPDPLFTETDQGIRIRIKMKRICNTANCYSFSEVKYEALKGLFTGFSKFHGKFLWV